MHKKIEIIKLIQSDEADTGSAGGQPARNNPIDWNGLGVDIVSAPIIKTIPVIYASENSCITYFNKAGLSIFR